MKQFKLERTGNGVEKIEFQVNSNENKNLSLHFNSVEKVWLNGFLYDSLGRLRGQIVTPETNQTYILTNDDESTSVSFIAGPLNQGIWCFEYSLASKEEAEVCLTIEMNTDKFDIDLIYPKRKLVDLGSSNSSYQSYLDSLDQENSVSPKWYKGDFHTHTIESDGSMTINDNQKQAQKMGLDFYVPTDHNVIPTRWHSGDPVVYPGVELTSQLGHCNLLFINHMLFDRNSLADIYQESSLLDILTNRKSEDYLLSINHPFLTVWKWLLKDLPLDVIDAIEIINDPTYLDNISANLATLAFWDLLLEDGYDITVIGGSDSHLRPDDRYPDSKLPSLLGDPGTFVFSKSLGSKDMILAIREGHVTVGRLGKLDFDMNGQIAGSQMAWQAGVHNVTYNYQSEGIFDENKLRVEIVQDSKVIYTSRDFAGSIEISVMEGHRRYSWVRVQVIHEDLGLVAVANPVYLGSKTTTYKTWGDVLEDFDMELK